MSQSHVVKNKGPEEAAVTSTEQHPRVPSPATTGDELAEMAVAENLPLSMEYLLPRFRALELLVGD